MSQAPGGPPVDWRRLHALGWPAGSVRAVLALMVFGAIWGLLLVRPDREVPDYLRDLMFIILGHYFAARARASGPASESGPPPLYLPRGSVRLLLILGSIAVAVILGRRRQLAEVGRSPGALTLLLVAGFLLGVVLGRLGDWWQARGHRTPRIVEDVRALVSLLAAGLLIALIWNQVAPFLPRLGHEAWRLGAYGPEHALAAVVGFYFGSRS